MHAVISSRVQAVALPLNVSTVNATVMIVTLGDVWHTIICKYIQYMGCEGQLAAGQVGQEETMEQRCLFLTAGHLGFLRFWDTRFASAAILSNSHTYLLVVMAAIVHSRAVF